MVAPVAWTHRVSGSSIFARYIPPLFQKGLDPDAVESRGRNTVHDSKRPRGLRPRRTQGVQTAFWRGVGVTHNVFVVESFIDELAAAAKQDPVAYRKALIATPADAGGPDSCGGKSGLGQTIAGPVGPRHLRAIRLRHLHVDRWRKSRWRSDGAVRVHRIVCAADCGIVINPDTIAAQVEGGTLFGLTAALYGAITVKNGRVEQSNFHDYRPMRMNESPVVETHLVKSAEPPGGFGEAPTAAVAPAVTNAILRRDRHAHPDVADRDGTAEIRAWRPGTGAMTTATYTAAMMLLAVTAIPPVAAQVASLKARRRVLDDPGQAGAFRGAVRRGRQGDYESALHELSPCDPPADPGRQPACPSAANVRRVWRSRRAGAAVQVMSWNDEHGDPRLVDRHHSRP